MAAETGRFTDGSQRTPKYTTEMSTPPALRVYSPYLIPFLVAEALMSMYYPFMIAASKLPYTSTQLGEDAFRRSGHRHLAETHPKGLELRES